MTGSWGGLVLTDNDDNSTVKAAVTLCYHMVNLQRLAIYELILSNYFSIAVSLVCALCGFFIFL
jgi:hypothetical protein